MPQDSNGTEIKIGQTVAFNYSGAVILGKIDRIGSRKNPYKYSNVVNIDIKHLNSNQISKIKNSNGICVLSPDIFS